MIVLYQNESSPFCDKIRRALHFKKRAFETREVPMHETLVRVGASVGEVPVIEHEGTVVSDSSDIVRYLDRVFPEPPLYPAGARDRALCHVLEDWADESLYFFELWFRFMLPHNAGESSRSATQSEPPLLRRAAEAALPTLVRNVLRAQGIGRKDPEQVLADFARHVDALAALLEGDWLIGGAPTIADIAVYAQLAYALDTGEGAAVLGDHPRVLAWMERVNASTAA